MVLVVDGAIAVLIQCFLLGGYSTLGLSRKLGWVS